MTSEAIPQPPHPLRARIAGILLLLLGGGCAYLFTVYSNFTLARFGFPRAWAGAPILLGAAFCGINGGFLLAQRRFSLGALLAAGIVAALLASGAQAYILSNRATASLKSTVYVPKEKQQQFIERVQGVLTAERLMAFAEDLSADCQLRQVLDFHSMTVSIAASPAQSASSDVITTLDFEYAPFIHVKETGIRGLVRTYVTIVNDIKAADFDDSPDAASFSPKTVAAYFAVNEGMHYADYSQPVMLFLGVRRLLHPSASPGYWPIVKLQKIDREAMLWLRDHEPDVRLKQFFADVLKEFDSLTNESAR